MRVRFLGTVGQRGSKAQVYSSFSCTASSVMTEQIIQQLDFVSKFGISVFSRRGTYQKTAVQICGICGVLRQRAEFCGIAVVSL